MGGEARISLFGGNSAKTIHGPPQFLISTFGPVYGGGVVLHLLLWHDDVKITSLHFFLLSFDAVHCWSPCVSFDCCSNPFPLYFIAIYVHMKLHTFFSSVEISFENMHLHASIFILIGVDIYAKTICFFKHFIMFFYKETDTTWTFYKVKCHYESLNQASPFIAEWKFHYSQVWQHHYDLDCVFE